MKIDPKGVRTVGVVTKIDIMDRGTNAKRMILNQEVHLRMGYVGVKNRAQEDIINQIPVAEAIEKEKMYFSSHPIYSSMPSGTLGCDVLIQKLTGILFTHIKHTLPVIVNEIREKLRADEEDLRELGPPLPSDHAEKMQLIWSMILEFLRSYENQIKGKFDARTKAIQDNKRGPQKSEIQGGAKIKWQFHKLYSDLEAFNASQEYTDMVIEKAIVNLEGINISGFPSIDLFVYLLTPQLEKLREPALDLVQDVYANLEFMTYNIIDKIFMRFPTLKPEIIDIVNLII